MDWALVVVVAIFALAYIFLRRSGQISAQDAQNYLRNGALVVDVRTPAEFSARHLPGAINVPLDQIEATFSRRVTDKNEPILLHCQAGTRSAVAKRKLISLGYTNARNLGSYSRAARLIDLAKMNK
ncbi:MAG TPA: rhodanese-like domain-containing protein [Terracidiphilus sp.]|nr:rhodanese-like domain-containing protein [Terracidiphilus sp.]